MLLQRLLSNSHTGFRYVGNEVERKRRRKERERERSVVAKCDVLKYSSPNRMEWNISFRDVTYTRVFRVDNILVAGIRGLQAQSVSKIST